MALTRSTRCFQSDFKSHIGRLSIERRRRRAIHQGRDLRHRPVLVARYFDWGNEALAASGDIYNEPVAIAPIAQRATQRGNMNSKIGRLDKYVGPNPAHQFVLADQLTCSLKQHNQDFQSATPKAHRLIAFEQKKMRREQAERPE
jgi:hypothetical protein